MVGTRAMRLGVLERAVGEVCSREDLRHHAQAVRLLHVDGVTREHELLRATRAELPGVAEVLHPAHAQPGADHVGEDHVVGGHDEVTGPHQHEPGRIDGPVHLGDGDLAQVPPAQGVLEVVVPLLEHEGLGPFAGGAIDGGRAVLVGTGPVFSLGLLRTYVVSRGEHRAHPTEDHHPYLVVLFGPHEGVVEVDQKPTVLGVAGLGPVEEDPHDLATVELLVGDELVVGHGPSPRACRVTPRMTRMTASPGGPRYLGPALGDPAWRPFAHPRAEERASTARGLTEVSPRCSGRSSGRP